MEGSSTSAFSLCIPADQIPESHKEIWNSIKTGLKAGRTFSYAACCRTVFDKRRKELTSGRLAHPVDQIESLYNALGKRVFIDERDFSIALARRRAKDPDNLLEFSFDNDHLSIQNATKIANLEKEVETLKDNFQTKIDGLATRVTALEADNSRLKKEVETESKHKKIIIEMSRRLVTEKTPNLCLVCTASCIDLVSSETQVKLEPK